MVDLYQFEISPKSQFEFLLVDSSFAKVYKHSSDTFTNSTMKMIATTRLSLGLLVGVASAAQMVNNVTIRETMFATIDNAWSSAAIDTYCSSGIITSLPQDWEVATDSEEARLAIELYSFGTENILIKDKILTHNLTVLEGRVVNSENGVLGEAPCPNRMLLRRKDVVEYIAPYVAVNITNFITFLGNDYAVASNIEPSQSDVSICDTERYVLNSGWVIADDNEDSRAVAISKRYSFKNTCKATLSGVGYNGGTEEPCQTEMLNRVESSTLNVTIVSVKVGKCGTLLLKRASNSSNTWSVSTPITNILSVKNMTYATLDNTSPDKLYFDDSGNCQDIAMRVPVNWTVANTSMPGFYEAAAHPWGTYCIGGRSFINDTCESPIATTANFAAVAACDQRVLIVKTTEIDCSSKWTGWSTCLPSCSPTQSRAFMNQSTEFGVDCRMVEYKPCSEEFRLCDRVLPTVSIVPSPSTATSHSVTSLLVSVTAAVAAAVLLLSS